MVLPLRKLVIVGAAVALLVGAYAAAGFFGVPWLVRKQATEFVATHYDRTLALGEVEFNPFTFTLRVRDARLPDADGAPLLAVDGLTVNAGLASLWRRGASFQDIDIEGPYVRLLVRGDGELNLSDLGKPFEGEGEAEDEEPARLFIDHLRVRGGRASFEDLRREAPVTVFEPIGFSLIDFSTTADTGNAYAIHAETESGASFDWSGNLALAPFGSKGKFSLAAIDVPWLWQYVGDPAIAISSGRLALDGEYVLDAGPTPAAFTANVREIALTELALRPAGAEADIATLPQVTATDAKLDLAARSLTIARLAAEGGFLHAWRETDGRLNLLDLAGSPDTEAAETPAEAPPAKAPPATEEDAAPWTIAVPEIAVQAFEVRLEDREIEPAVAWRLAPLALEVKGFSTAPGSTLAITAGTGIGEDGRFDVEATYGMESGDVEGKLALAGFDLTPLQPYLDRYTRMDLLSGRVSAELAGRRSGDSALTVRGDLQVDGLRTEDRDLGEDFINWQSLRVEGADYDSTKNRLRIKAIKARAPYARVIIAPDQTVNVAKVLKPAKPEPALTRAEQAVGLPARDYTKTAVTIDTITIADGSMNFADFWIRPNYAVSLQGLAGTLSGLSSDPDSRAKLDLAGKVDRYAPAVIQGELNLLSASVYSDIQVKFAGVELSSLTPYSGRFAGYAIEKGKLTVDVNYHVENRQLTADHRFVIDQLQLGERIESPDAVSLPLKLAVALLKDRNGVIDIGLPVSGSLDDPQFRLGPIIWKAFLGLLRKVATAPFALLGRLFGGGEELNLVEFEPGKAALDPAAQVKMESLRKALVERPGLRLDVPMGAAADVDGPALAREKLEQLLAVRAGGGKDAGKPAEPEKVAAALADPERRYELLLAQHRETVGQDAALSAEAQAYEDARKRERTPDMLAAATAALEEVLVAALEVPPAELEALGKARAAAIQEALLASGEVDPARVFLIAGPAKPAGGETPRAQLELSLQ